MGRYAIHSGLQVSRLLLFACCGLVAVVLSACAGVSPGARLDNTPRLAVMSAFEPELTLLLGKIQNPVSHHINGVGFTTGLLESQPVVLFLSGISMTNATMNTQLVLDRFNIKGIVFSGIAGGVNPSLHIGDVAVPAQWGQYLEIAMSRETSPGKFTPPPHMEAPMFPAFGMMQPRTVETRTAANPKLARKFWFEADPKMLEVARNLRSVELNSCKAAHCLSRKPELLVGGNGVSGQAFVDNAAFREYAFKTFQANVLDMETAAVGMVAYSNGVPYIAFRSLSDLAGGGDGANEMGTFFSLAADNSARVLLAFLAAWKQ